MRLSRTRHPNRLIAAAAVVLGLAAAATAHAAGSGMTWEEPLQQVLESVQGPVAKIVAVIIIIVTGLTLAFGETAGGFRRDRERVVAGKGGSGRVDFGGPRNLKKKKRRD